MAPIKFGILMIPFQMLDVAGPVDILSTCSKSMISDFEEIGVPGAAGMSNKAIDIEFHYVGTSLDPVKLNANMHFNPTTTVDTCPPLDYLLIGGPDPFKFKLDEKFGDFIRTHVARGKGIFATCTGGLALSQTGILDGRTATTNHQALDVAKKMRPQVKWVKEQWVEDGQFWTAGGACAGMDMFSHWVAERYPADLAAMGLAGLDFEPRDIDGKRFLRAEQVV